MSLRAAWLTDVHFDHAGRFERDFFIEDVKRARPDVIFLTGDISVAYTLERELAWLADECAGIPIYFVLGNHDYWHSTLAEVKRKIDSLAAARPQLVCLDNVGVVSLTPATALVGAGGWADGRTGDYDSSPGVLLDHPAIRHLTREPKSLDKGAIVQLNAILKRAEPVPIIGDYSRVGEFIGLDMGARQLMLARLGDEAAAHFSKYLPPALESHEKVIVLTHVPPFAGATWHEGKPSNPAHLPHFCNTAAGDALMEAARAFPKRKIHVYCGHTHGGGSFLARRNLRVRTGPAIYGMPGVTDVITVL